MKHLNAELVDVDGEQAVMQIIRNSTVPEILGEQSIVVPICNIDQALEASTHENFWVPISLEDPIHISVDYRYDQHNVIEESQKPEIDFYDNILEGNLSSEQREWLDGYRHTQAKNYKFMGTIAATDLSLDPSTEIDRLDKKRLARVNETFNEMIGEWGGFLCATVSYIRIEETTETFTSAQLRIIESSEEFEEVRGENPSELF